MNQTTTTDTHSVSDLEAVRLQLEEDGKVYCENQNSKEYRERLLHTLQTNDCQEIITAIVDGDDLANVFARAGNRNHVDILEAFLNHGMNVDIKDKIGWPALMYAICSQQGDCVRFLLGHNVKVDVQNKYGETALIIASQNGNTNIVEMLLKKNANPDIQSQSGWTALISASLRGYREIVQVLLNHGADIELKMNDGKTALDLAKNEEIKEMIRNHVNTSYVLK